MPEVSIIIPCYLKNQELLDLTKSTIHSFEQADLPDYEIIIVDDNSPQFNGYLRTVANTYIKHRTNEGFIKSINDGMNVARGKYWVLANNDIRVEPHFFNVSKDILDGDEDVISVHPRMLFYEEPMTVGDSVYTTGRERWCQSSFFITRGGMEGHRFPEHFEGTGGAYEDWYFWALIRKSGSKTAYTTRTCFQHKDSSTTQVVGEQSKHHAENKELFREVFGKYPEEYYMKLYPEQMSKPWREYFQKL